MKQIRYSFIIPVYDRVREFRECLYSIFMQTYTDYEVLIVFDGSPPETRAVLNEFELYKSRIRVYSYESSSGTACRGRNKGIIEARGEFISFLDSDDISPPNRLELTDAVFSTSNCDVVFGSVRFLTEETRRIEGIEFADLGLASAFTFEELWIHNRIYMLTTSIRRDVLLRYGGFRPELSYREDYELWLRLMNGGCVFVGIDDVLGIYRIHGGNNELNFKDNDLSFELQSKDLYDKPFINWGI